MAEPNVKTDEVELDTDDAKAETVEVKEPEKKEETKEDVNLNAMLTIKNEFDICTIFYNTSFSLTPYQTIQARGMTNF